jgi:hypothetical protein
MARHRDETNGWLWVFPSLMIPLLIAATAWTTHVASEGDEIAPNVRFAGVDISGSTPSDAAEQVRAREREFLSTPVSIDLGEREIVMTAEEAGYVYLYDQTLADVVAARHGDGIWSEFKLWAATPFEPVTVSDKFALDVTKATARMSQDDFVIEHAIEPELTNSDASYMYVIPGTDGTGVDVEGIVDDLVDAEIAAGPVAIDATHVVVPPTVSDDAAREAALELNEMTRPGFLAVVGDFTAQLSPGKVRSHLRSTIEDGEISVDIDVDAFQEEVEAAFPEPIGEFIDPVLVVDDGNVVVESVGEAAPVCCSRESVEAAVNQYLAGGQTFYSLEARPDDDPQTLAWADGSLITEPVAEFTTNHPCCESRVTNIQTMADFMRGKYLLPGETLSINDYVGPRTPDKGYVSAGAIRGGHMIEELGGGVSQFITTLFNAAFYGGLDLDEYQSHSIYFSRYPYGREATLSIPGPDLVITNSTDHPVLIWPTYDDTSITVTLYSTKNVTVDELGQRISRRNQCTHSEIDRQRTFSDGRVEVDTIVANYRPGDGIDCNGNPIPEED